MNVLVKHLRDIGRPAVRGPALPRIAADAMSEDASLMQAAYERGVEDTLCRASVAIEQALSAAKESVASLRSQWTTECQDRVCREAAAGRSLIESRVSADLVDALSPFIEAKQKERIRRAFLERLRETAIVNSEIRIKLFGPADERMIVVDCLGEMGITAIFHERDQPTIDAEIGSGVLRADFSGWARRWLAEFGDCHDV